MRKLGFKENTIKDLGTLNRGQSMLLSLYVKGYTHTTLNVYHESIELTVYAKDNNDATAAEIIIRNSMADGDTLQYDELSNDNGPFVTYLWRGHLTETEDE